MYVLRWQADYNEWQDTISVTDTQIDQVQQRELKPTIITLYRHWWICARDGIKKQLSGDQSSGGKSGLSLFVTVIINPFSV